MTDVLGVVLFRFIVAICLGALAAMCLTAYYAINISRDLKEPIGRPGTFPLMVEDEELETHEGRRARDLMQRWLLISFALCIVGAVLIYVYHAK